MRRAEAMQRTEVTQLPPDPAFAPSTLVASPQPWILPEGASLLRVSTRPVRFRQEGFDAAFDKTTLFYDCFLLPDGRQALLLGPPLLNLAPTLSAIRVRAEPSGSRCKTRIRTLDRHAQLWVELPQGTTALKIDAGLESRLIAPLPNESDTFTGKRVLLTHNRNNRLEWILDWARFHRDVQGADAILLYDNGSTDYSVSELAAALLTLKGFAAIRVVDWPFKFGPQSFHGKYWDSDFCQFGLLEDARWRFLQQARSILSCDIDELVMTRDDQTIFQMAEKSHRGYVRFHGQWILSIHADGTSETLPNAAHSRHRDYQTTLLIRHEWKKLRRVKKNLCAAKWAGVPAILPARAQWKIHAIGGMWSWPAGNTQVNYRHFRGINTSWKYERALSERFDAALHSTDTAWMRTSGSVHWDS